MVYSSLDLRDQSVLAEYCGLGHRRVQGAQGGQRAFSDDGVHPGAALHPLVGVGTADMGS